MRKKTPPILDPKLVECWSKGGLAPFVIKGFDHSTAASLRHRLYRERLKMRELTHPDTSIADRATISITPSEKGTFQLVIYPANYLIEKALADAGITTGDPPPLD